MKTAMAVVAVMLSMSAGAEPVYKCEEKGVITYTDRPCAPGAIATELPELIVAEPPGRSQQDLAREHDERLARERAERDSEDARWLKEHAENKAREAGKDDGKAKAGKGRRKK